MTTDQPGAFLEHVRQLVGGREADGWSDGQLLERFVATRDEAAFAPLVGRHGRLVLAACRSVLRRQQDAEDAFQATFLVLARAAGSVRKGDALAGWLYGVALRTARKARRAMNRRLRHEQRAEARPPEAPPAEAALREMQGMLHEEIGRLPEKYRTPFVLCCLEGKSRAEAAATLACNEGTLSGRIARARDLLERRLSRRGVVLTAALAAAALAPPEPALWAATVLNALAFAARSPAVAAPVAALAEGVMRSMFLAKLKLVAPVVFLFLVLGGACALAYSAARPPAGKEAPESPAAPEQPPDAARPKPPGEERRDENADPLPPHALARLGSLRWRFTGPVADLAYSADGKRLVLCERGFVRVVDLGTGAELRSFQAQYSLIRSLVLSSDDRAAVTGGSREIVIWDTKTGERVRSFRCHASGSWDLCGSADGKVLAAVGDDNDNNPRAAMYIPTDYSVRVWDATTGEQLKPFAGGKLNRAARVTLSADGKALAWATLGGVVRAVDVADGKERFSFKPVVDAQPGQPAHPAFAFSPDGRLLACGSGDDLLLLDARTGREEKRCRRKEPGQVKGPTGHVAFTPDGKGVAASAADGTVGLWDVATGREVRRFPGPPSVRFVFSPDGQTVAGPGYGQGITLIDTATGRRKPVPGQTPALGLLALSPDGKTVAALEAERIVALWDWSSGKVRHRLRLDESPQGAAFTPDGRTFVAVGARPVLWDVQTGRKTRELPASNETPTSVALSPDGRWLAGGNGSGVILLWDLRRGELTRLVGNGKAWVFSVAFSGDGKKLLAGTGDIIAQAPNPSAGPDNAVYVWDLATHKELRRIQVPPLTVNKLAVSPDGKLLVASPTTRDVGAVPVWDVDSGKEVGRLPSLGGPPLSAVAFSPDGKTLTAACNLPDYHEAPGTIHLFDMKTMKSITTLKGHSRAVTSLAFSADGAVLASGGDGTVLLWDVGRVGR